MTILNILTLDFFWSYFYASFFIDYSVLQGTMSNRDLSLFGEVWRVRMGSDSSDCNLQQSHGEATVCDMCQFCYQVGL